MLDDSCSGGCKVVLTSARDIQKYYGKEFQLWKVDGTSLRSQFNDAVIGVGANGDGESPLSAYTYPYTGLDIVSIDPVTKSNYTSPIEGKFNSNQIKVVSSNTLLGDMPIKFIGKTLYFCIQVSSIRIY